MNAPDLFGAFFCTFSTNFIIFVHARQREYYYFFPLKALALKTVNMLHKTEGIVLVTSRYSDRYSIAHIFTRDFGRVPYLLPNTRGKKSKMKRPLFFPLSIINMEVEHLPLRDIQRLKDVETGFPLHEIYTDMAKVSISFFLSEFLYRVLRESGNNESTFDYVRNSVEALDAVDKGLANFHIAFMIGLTRFLGIYPNFDGLEKNSYFDLINGEFVRSKPGHSHSLDRSQSTYLGHLKRINYENMQMFKLSRENRNRILDYLIDYYRLHLYNFPHLKSLDVLRDIL